MLSPASSNKKIWQGVGYFSRPSLEVGFYHEIGLEVTYWMTKQKRKAQMPTSGRKELEREREGELNVGSRTLSELSEQLMITTLLQFCWCSCLLWRSFILFISQTSQLCCCIVWLWSQASQILPCNTHTHTHVGRLDQHPQTQCQHTHTHTHIVNVCSVLIWSEVQSRPL